MTTPFMLNQFYWWDPHHFRLSPFHILRALIRSSPLYCDPNFSQCFLYPLVLLLLFEADRQNKFHLSSTYRLLQFWKLLSIAYPNLFFFNLTIPYPLDGLLLSNTLALLLYWLLFWSQHWIQYFSFGLINTKEWTNFLHHYW